MPDNKRREEEAELRPTSAPPEDVDIPSDSIYGSSEPLDPIEGETSSTSEIEDSLGNSDGKKSTASRQDGGESASSSKSIKIGWLPLLLFLILLGGGLFVLGTRLGPELIGNKDVDGKEASGQTGLAGNTSEAGSKTEKPKKTLNFIKDTGIYKSDNTYDAEKLARLRLSKAKNSILWITSEPNNKALLSVLTDTKDEKGLPIVIVTGEETSRERIMQAKDKGFVVNQIQEELEVPYSFIIVDSKLLMDVSRKHWLWETTDKEILKETGDWLEDLTKNARIVN